MKTGTERALTLGLCLLNPPDKLPCSAQNFPNTKGTGCRNPALQQMLYVHMGQTNFNCMVIFFLSDSWTYAGQELVHNLCIQKELYS